MEIVGRAITNRRKSTGVPQIQHATHMARCAHSTSWQVFRRFVQISRISTKATR